VGTNKCLDKQLLCLYPFPHFSHLRSPALDFLPSFTRCWPSLARLVRACLNPTSSSPSMSSSFWSSMALSFWSGFTPGAMLMRWPGRLAGGDGSPAIPDLPVFEVVFLRAEMGMPIDVSPASLTAATIAATLLTVFDVTLFRRVTLWLGTRDPDDTECEWFRAWDCRGREPEWADVDRRCWLRGREM
jgi:hypothetical protein